MLYDFLMLLRRYKVSSVLNIAGMGLAFAAAYLMLVQVVFDFSYNRSLPDAADIYRLEYPSWYTDGSWGTTWNRHDPLEYCAAIPEVKAAATFRCEGYTNRDYSIKRNDTIDNITMNSTNCERAGLDVFGFECVAGSFDDFIGPYTAVISETAAKRCGLGVGDVLHSGRGATEGSHTLTVVAIYRDFPEPSSVAKNDMYMGMIPVEQHDRSNWNDPFYLRLAPGTLPETVEEKMKVFLREQLSNDGYSQEEIGRLLPTKAPRLNNVRDLYFSKDVEYNDGLTGNIATTYTLLSIAVLVIVIAFINFINFFFALIPVRLRAVNICKVFGASTRTLRWSFLFEAVGLVVCALLLTMYLTIVLPDTFVAEYVSRSLSLKDNLTAVLLLFGIGVVAALAAALYPSYYITSFNASLAVKSGFAGSGAGRRLRLVLVGVQFTVSIALIVVAACFWLQYRYMINYDIGIDRENLMCFNLSYKDGDMYPVLAERMNEMPEIVGVTASVDAVVGDGSAEVICMKYEGRDLELHFRYVRSNFLDVMGIRLAEGEDFSDDMDNAATKYAIMCRSTCDEYGFYPGFVVMAGTTPICRVIGIMDDVLGQPLDSKQSNTVYCTTSEDQWMGDVYFRTAANVDIPRLCDKIRAVAKEINPESEDLKIEFVDERLQQLYEKTQRSATIIGLFALLAVVISLMGVFGIVLFETQHRRREIALRRVLGSTVEGVIWMFGRHYITIVAVCFAIAVPVAWYVVSEWLNRFAYRIPTPWWIFAAAFLLVTALTLGIVVVRCRRAASENPARVLGGE